MPEQPTTTTSKKTATTGQDTGSKVDKKSKKGGADHLGGDHLKLDKHTESKDEQKYLGQKARILDNVMSDDPQTQFDGVGFKLFSQRVASLCGQLGLQDNPDALARELWFQVGSALRATEGTYDFLAEQAKQKAQVEEDLLASKEGRKPMEITRARVDMTSELFQSLVPEFDILASRLTEIAQVQAMQAETWGFWSGSGAGECARSFCDISLEGGAVGWLFDGINFTGDWDMQLWAALSRAYANLAVNSLSAKEIHGFVGPNVGAMTVFDAIEAPAIQAGNETRLVPLTVTFHAVAVDPSEKLITSVDDLKKADPIKGAELNLLGEYPSTWASLPDREEIRKQATARFNTVESILKAQEEKAKAPAPAAPTAPTAPATKKTTAPTKKTTTKKKG